MELKRERLGEGPTFELHTNATRQYIERLRAELAELGEPSYDARAEFAAAQHVLSGRQQAAATAARLSPPDYITAELGARPSDPTKAREWDRAVQGIEGYRTRNGVVDRDTALGPKPHDHTRQREQQQARERIERAQRQLQLQQSTERVTDLSIGI